MPSKKEDLLDARDVLLELDGPGVSPTSVDATTFLRLAAAFFRLLKGNAESSDRSLSLTGVAIIDKCLALSARSDDPEVAQFFATAALRQIGGEDPPHGLQQLADEARAAVRGIPEGQQAKIIIGPWTRVVPSPPPSPPLLWMRSYPSARSRFGPGGKSRRCALSRSSKKISRFS